jgi:hypothetical protein
MKIPNFLIIGANKGGTSSLYKYFEQHPEICMSSIKEPMFFLYFKTPEKLQSFDLDKEPEWEDWKIISTEQDYLKLFETKPNTKAAGEASTAYLANPYCADAIKQYNPKMKIIAVLRNPVDRAYSSYKMYVKMGVELDSFAWAVHQELKGNKKDSQGSFYIQLGFYFEALKKYYDVFGAENVRVYLKEDLDKSSDWFFNDVFSFLGVDANFKPDTTTRYNVGKKNVVTRTWKTGLKEFFAENNLLPLLPKFLSGRINVTEIAPSADFRKKLTLLYQEDIKKTAQLINRDLSSWLNS